LGRWLLEKPKSDEMEEKIMTLHPEGKNGVNISKEKYEAVRGAILDSVRAHGEITFRELTGDVGRRLEGAFEGSINWYVTTVKLDLEARGLVERVPGKTPQRLRLGQD
jgi:hypothetical protein